MVATVFASCEKGNGNNNDSEPAPDPEPELHTSLKGSDYAIVFMDDTTIGSIEEKISLDLRNNGANINWYDWAGNTMGIEKSGKNFYGGDETSWLAIKLADVGAGWSGAGMNVTSDTPGLKDYFARVAAEPSKYYLHFAYKSSQSGKGAVIYPAWYSNDTYKVSIGETAQTVYDSSIGVTEEKELLTPLSGQYKAGEWNEYEICVADFNYDYSAEYSDGATNVFCVLLGADAENDLNKEFEVDAVFYYKK